MHQLDVHRQGPRASTYQTKHNKYINYTPLGVTKGSIGVHVGYIACSYKCSFCVLVSWPHLGLLNNTHMTSCKLSNLL
jgi:hypothetical protein